MPEIKAVGHPAVTKYMAIAAFSGDPFNEKRLLDKGWEKADRVMFKSYDKKWEAVYAIRDSLHELDSAVDVILVDPHLASDIEQSLRVYA